MIDKLLTQTVEIPSRLVGELEKKRQIFLDLMGKMQQEKTFLEGSLEDCRNLTFRLRKKEPKLPNLRFGDRYLNAISLAREGLSPNKISSKVNISVGENELVLSLTK